MEGIEDEGLKNKWEYYVNQVYEMDQFAGNLIQAIEDRGEPTVVVFYGDHLPTMGLEAEGPEEPVPLQYQLCDLGQHRASRRRTGISRLIRSWRTCWSGWISTPARCSTITSRRRQTRNYLSDLELLQYDILYGDQYVYTLASRRSRRAIW